MVEVMLALALVVGGLALVALPPQLGMWGAAIVTAGALVIGLIASAVYHARLRGVLRPRGLLPSYWWLHPLPLHPLLDDFPRERRAVLHPFRVGVVCAVMCLASTVMGSIFAVRTIL